MLPSRLLFLLALSTAPACTTYRVVADPATALREAPEPLPQVRVTLRDGEVLRLRGPRVLLDSLVGTVQKDSVRVVALHDVAGVESMSVNGWKTALVIIGPAALLIGVLAAGMSGY